MVNDPIDTDEDSSGVAHTGLKRSVSLPLIVFYGLGNILGAGIYVLIGEVAAVAGYDTPISFLFSALVVIATALSYAELVSRFPRSAGEAAYVQQAFGREYLSTIIGLLICLAGIVSSAALAKGFVGYLAILLPVDEVEVVLVLAAVLAVIAIWGISESVKIVAMITVLEIAGLLAVIVSGLDASLSKPVDQALVEQTSWSGVWFGAFLAFYAFLGFEDMVNIAEEVKRPRIYLPVAIIVVLVLATLLYTLVSFVVVNVVSPSELAASKAPLALIVNRALGFGGAVIAVIGLLAVINGALAQIIMSSRVLYGMARQGLIPSLLGKVWPLTRTPVIATAATSIAVAILAVLLPVVSLAAATSLLILVVFILVNSALVRIKSTQKDKPVPFEVPFWVPIAGIITTAGLAIFSLIMMLTN